VTTSLVVAIAACAAAALALAFVVVLWRRISRIRATQAVVLGSDRRDLLDFAVSLQGRIDDLHRALDEVAAGLSRVDRRVDGSVTIITVGVGGAIDTEQVMSPVIGFILDQKGLMYNLTLEGSKISRIDP